MMKLVKNISSSPITVSRIFAGYAYGITDEGNIIKIWPHRTNPHPAVNPDNFQDSIINEIGNLTSIDYDGKRVVVSGSNGRYAIFSTEETHYNDYTTGNKLKLVGLSEDFNESIRRIWINGNDVYMIYGNDAPYLMMTSHK